MFLEKKRFIYIGIILLSGGWDILWEGMDGGNRQKKEWEVLKVMS